MLHTIMNSKTSENEVTVLANNPTPSTVSLSSDNFRWVAATVGAFGNATAANGYAFIAAPALNDMWLCKVTLPIGPMTIQLHGQRSADRGITNVYLNGVVLPGSTMDWYKTAPSDALLLQFTYTNTNPSEQTLMIRMDSKNASSTNYYLLWSHISFIPQ